MSFFSLCKEECNLYFQDKWLLVSVIFIPIFLFIFFINIFRSGQILNIPIGIVDLDKSNVSRMLIRQINASPKLLVQSNFRSTKEAKDAVRAKKIYAFLIIPKDMEKKIKKSLPVQVTHFYNGQFLLVGRSVNSTVNTIFKYFSTKISVQQKLTKQKTTLQKAKQQSSPISQQVTPLFNLNLNYAKFLLTAIMPAIWQILLVATMVLSFAAQNNKTKILPWIQKKGLKGYIAKLFIHQIVMMCVCVIFLSYQYGYEQWEMRGSWSVVLFSAWLCIVASQAMASMLYFTTLDATRTMSLSAGYTAPSLAFMGVTFPYSDMSIFAKIWSSLIPITHYVKIQIDQANHGAPLSYDAIHMGKLFIFCGAFLVVWLRIRLLKQKDNT